LILILVSCHSLCLEDAKFIESGMKNYIANESGGWATSSAYVKQSFARSIQFGRTYTSGHQRGREEDLCEALRCFGQALHTLEDFSAHSNYTELALRELGFKDVFPHTGTSTIGIVQGKEVYPLVTGTFGGVDFLHSLLGEATDHVSQSELDIMNQTLGSAVLQSEKPSGSSTSSDVDALGQLLSKIPGTANLIQQAFNLKAASDAQAAANNGARAVAEESNDRSIDFGQSSSQNRDQQTIIDKVYPILVFRDSVVRTITEVVSKIPGLESLIETINERLTIFVFSLLAPYIQPVITTARTKLKLGSSLVIASSKQQQHEPWTDPHCTDSTHSLLSKDHFTNILNPPAGQVAATILQYVAPRVIHAWEHPEFPIDPLLNDIVTVFHHPALRNSELELHRNMFSAVEMWVQSLPDRGASLNSVLSSESVREGRNHSGEDAHGTGGHSHGGAFTTIPNEPSMIEQPNIIKVNPPPVDTQSQKTENSSSGQTSTENTAPQWTMQAEYQIGSIVSYKGAKYTCLQAHHVYAPNWDPESAAALWTKL
jgi:hypothetical protein